MGMCDGAAGYLPHCLVGKEIKGGAAAAGNSAFESIANSFAKASESAVKAMATMWIKVEPPTLSTNSGPIHFLYTHEHYMVTLLAVLMTAVAGADMALRRNPKAGKNAAAGLARMAISSGTSITVLNLLVTGLHQYSEWIISRSLSCDSTDPASCSHSFGKAMFAMVSIGSVNPGTAAGVPAMVFAVSLLLLGSSFIQIILMIVRSAALILLAGTLPFAAASSGTEKGKAWFEKVCSWLLAWAFYDPVAATVYAVGFASVNTTHPSTMNQLSGCALIFLSIFTLPALMRLAVPAMSAVTSNEGSGAGAALASVGTTIATGAMSVKGGGSAGAGGARSRGGSEASGASGAQSTPVPNRRPAAPETAPSKEVPSGSTQTGGTTDGGPSGASAGGSPPGPSGASGSGNPSGPSGAQSAPAPRRTSEEGPSGSK